MTNNAAAAFVMVSVSERVLRRVKTLPEDASFDGIAAILLGLAQEDVERARRDGLSPTARGLLLDAYIVVISEILASSVREMIMDARDKIAYDQAKAADTGGRTSFDDMLAQFGLTHADLDAIREG